jgi:hypothetical protein
MTELFNENFKDDISINCEVYMDLPGCFPDVQDRIRSTALTGRFDGLLQLPIHSLYVPERSTMAALAIVRSRVRPFQPKKGGNGTGRKMLHCVRRAKCYHRD